MRLTRVFWSLPALLTLSVGCESPLAPDTEPAERFGSVTALIGGRAWTSSLFSDSIVAFYEPSTGRLQITGQEFTASHWPTLNIFIPEAATAAPYHLGGFGGLHAEWFDLRPPTRPRVTALGAFVSKGGVQDSLIIEQLDLSARTIRARFHFTAQEIRGFRVLSFAGRVAGRIVMIGQ